jgi:iron(III) transport system substrate-binding protein
MVWHRLPIVLILVLLVGACGAPAAPDRASGPAGSGGAAQAPDSTWEQTVAAARREGKISIIAPQGSEIRDSLVEGFQKRYPDIQVDINGMAGNAVGPKLLTEVAAGQNLTDLVFSGSTTMLGTLQPGNALAPIAPYLVGPNLANPAVWRDGKLRFADTEGTYTLVFGGYAKEGFIYNPDIVNPAEIRSYRDLLDPKWRGKIAWRNPRGAGGGRGYAVLWYFTDGLGPDFIRQLVAQDVVFTNDDRQLLDWVARGQYPIAFGPSNVLIAEYLGRGIKIAALDATQLREGTYFTSGNGNVAVVTNPPHPNATKVYLDYFLSREGQQEWGVAGARAPHRVGGAG